MFSFISGQCENQAKKQDMVYIHFLNTWFLDEIQQDTKIFSTSAWKQPYQPQIMSYLEPLMRIHTGQIFLAWYS